MWQYLGAWLQVLVWLGAVRFALRLERYVFEVSPYGCTRGDVVGPRPSSNGVVAPAAARTMHERFDEHRYAAPKRCARSRWTINACHHPTAQMEYHTGLASELNTAIIDMT